MAPNPKLEGLKIMFLALVFGVIGFALGHLTCGGPGA